MVCNAAPAGPLQLARTACDCDLTATIAATATGHSTFSCLSSFYLIIIIIIIIILSLSLSFASRALHFFLALLPFSGLGARRAWMGMGCIFVIVQAPGK
jgi:hypothetical protein